MKIKKFACKKNRHAKKRKSTWWSPAINDSDFYIGLKSRKSQRSIAHSAGEHQRLGSKRRRCEAGKIPESLDDSTKTAPFFCALCRRTFTTVRRLVMHARSSHRTGNDVVIRRRPSYRCRQCRSRFTSSMRLGRHRLTAHRRRIGSQSLLAAPDRHRYSCTYCPASFSWYSCLSGHVRRQHGDQGPGYRSAMVGCWRCRRQFPSTSTLNGHTGSDHAARAFGCRLCGRTFEHAYSLQFHARRPHPPSVLDPKGSKIKSRNRHPSRFRRRPISLRKRVLLPVGGAGDWPAVSMLVPRRRMSNESDFSDRLDFRGEVVQKSLRCPLCPGRSEVFGWYTTLSAHKSYRHGVPPIRRYGCSACKRSFATAGDLLRHRAVRNAVRGAAKKGGAKYACRLCSFECKSWKRALRHEKKHSLRKTPLMKSPKTRKHPSNY